MSGSTDGLPIKVTGTNTAGGVTIHTAQTGTINFDRVFLWADSDSASIVLLTVEWGGTTSPDNVIKINVPIQGTGSVQIADGIPLRNAKIIRAFADTANVIKITGYIQRYTEA